MAAHQHGDDFLGALEGIPLVCADLDRDDAFAVPVAFPAAVVVRQRVLDASAPAHPRWADIALTESPDPPAPWVAVADLDEAVARLEAAAGASPTATVTLAHVLRCGGRDAEVDLVQESLAYSTLQGGPEFGRWLAEWRREHPIPPAGTSSPASTSGTGAAYRGDTGPAVSVERRGNRLLLELSRPEVHNAYSAEIRDALCEALAVALADPDITEVELRGKGTSFCSGGDLREFGTLADPATAHAIRTARSAGVLLSRLGPRVTTFLHGHCIGAGIELPAFTGRVVAEPSTRIRLPEVAMGLIPGAGGTASIPRRIGRHRTAWLALSGSTLDAQTALAWGLVDELV